jgi:hypothetical protein
MVMNSLKIKFLTFLAILIILLINIGFTHLVVLELDGKIRFYLFEYFNKSNYENKLCKIYYKYFNLIKFNYKIIFFFYN